MESFCYGELGLSPYEYRRLTLREYFIKRHGYIQAQRSIDNRLRILCYTISKPYLKNQDMSIWEFMPLEGDPTPEEIAQIEKENLEKEMIEARKERERILNRFRNARF